MGDLWNSFEKQSPNCSDKKKKNYKDIHITFKENQVKSDDVAKKLEIK